ncbi:hypothetical protein ITP53_46185, partial [Nonomuraea sp. K274]
EVVLRGLALLSALLLMVGPLQADLGQHRFQGVFSGTFPVWFLLLAVAQVAVAALREGRARAAALGVAAGLAALHLGLVARTVQETGFDTRPEILMTLAGAGLVLVVAFVETALAQVGPLRAVMAVVAGLLAVVLIIWNLRDPEMIGEDEGPAIALAAALILIAALVVRAVQDWRAGHPRLPMALSVAATLVIAGDLLAVYADTSSDEEDPAYLPILLVLLVVAHMPPDRFSLLTAFQLVVITGLVHNVALVETGLGFVLVLFAAAGCAGGAAYLSGLAGRGATRPG